ncbi:RmlC-like cupin domain-containing protein [Penicillium longicatenatum]|uniref:RmlC-like cupin domain-containing protein n=1 Tax=Penicillium longicatenatum TaxID=1561947 RepID=UPI0025471E5B|nr:RmlC-like cupin domain-containing protein [Penicillium longicatenatum]KAJ5636952.1 RmlC-like cupin domain-containing protein [Penicillium longicatenatum]
MPPTTNSSVQHYYDSLSSKDVSPLWTVLDKMVPPRPNPPSTVAMWRYDSLRPPLMDAGELVTAEEAERRVLMLVNPSREAPYTTDTIYAGLQLVLPGETAPAHRHMAFALRFIIEGSHGFTAVEGEKLMMARGDVILTPTWTWHDHGSEGTGPMVWLDGLDLPLYRFLPVNFAENYEKLRYPSTLTAKSKLKIPWLTAAASLDADLSTSYTKYEYRFEDGSHLSRTLSAQAERVAAGSTTAKSQETCSFVYHVYEGTGYSSIATPGGKEEKVEWKEKDTFSVPAWSSISHTCTMPNGQAYLFAINDKPIVEALGLWRKA